MENQKNISVDINQHDVDHVLNKDKNLHVGTFTEGTDCAQPAPAIPPGWIGRWVCIGGQYVFKEDVGQ